MSKVRAILYFGIFLCLINLFYIPKRSINNLIAQTYLGPKTNSPLNSHLIRVELHVKDSPVLSGLEIKKVTFNGQTVPLKPRDIFDKRGTASFQLPPGKYKLVWSVNRSTLVWPRTLNFEEEVTLDPRDLWVQIIIEGDQVSIR